MNPLPPAKSESGGFSPTAEGHSRQTNISVQGNAYFTDAVASLPASEVTTLLCDYRKYLAETCRFVPLRGVHREERHERGDPLRSTQDADQRLELERIFVELDTTAHAAVSGSSLERRPRPGGFGETFGGDANETVTRPLPALEAVVTCPSRHVVLHGKPGCGKSTFIRFLILGLAHCGVGQAEHWLPRLPSWPASEADLLPLRIELRLFAVWLKEREIKQAEPCHLWNYFNQWLKDLAIRMTWRDPLPAVEQTVRAGRAIFLLDGLDEVPGGNGKLFVRDCLEEFARRGLGQLCRIVVTCRTRSYEADYKDGRTLRLFDPSPPVPASVEAVHTPRPAVSLASSSVKEGAAPLPPTTAFELDDFDDPKKQRFIQSWYDALVTLGECERPEAADRVRALQQAVCDPQNPRLVKLAANPLLLTVICHLHSTQRDHKLPNNRAQLFHDLIDLLLSRWAERHQSRKEIGLSTPGTETLAELLADPGVGAFEQQHLMQMIAELAHDHYRGTQDEKLVLIPEATLRRRLMEKHHDNDTPAGAFWAERMLNFIQLRAGLLNSPDGGEHFDFPHSLLGEYLVAFHLARERRSSEIVAKKVTNDGNWDEVVRLVAGHHVFVKKETRDALDLVEELCKSAKSKDTDANTIADVDWRQVALAADILHEMGPERWIQERHQGPACRNQVRDLLVLLAPLGALPVRDRARAIGILGHLGDPRPAVGLNADDLPDLAWTNELPAGEFTLAENGTKVTIPAPYQLSLYPITVKQFRAFATEENYRNEEWWTEAIKAGFWKDGRVKTTDVFGRDEQWSAGPAELEARFNVTNSPIVNVNWFEAMAFCAFLSKRSGKQIRLPHEAEWEQAARWNEGKGAADFRNYPWDPTAQKTPSSIERAELSSHCNWNETGIGHTSAVGLFPKGKAECGAMDMAGNVWEWCENWYSGEEEKTRVLRGGSWANDIPSFLLCSSRLIRTPGRRFHYIGYRVVCVRGGSVG